MLDDDRAESGWGEAERQRARRWVGLAVGSLILAGSFAVFLVVARVPPFSGWVTDATFFKRCLVVHVDLSLVVWFYAFTAGLFALLPARRGGFSLDRVGFGLALGGVLSLFLGVLWRDARPVLANYVPTLDHPAYLLGLFAFFAGVGLSFVDARLLPWREAPGGLVPEEARPGLRAAALAYLLALLTFAGAAISMPAGLPPEGRYELLFWGGGHVLQFASVAAMVAVWLTLLTRALGRAPVSRKLATGLFALLVLPVMAAPVLALRGVHRGEVHGAFTELMRWGIFPVVVVFLVLCLRALVLGAREGRVSLRDGRVLAFLVSAALTVTGFILGALIRGANTMVPAHYHANIGAVTAAFMGVTVLVLDAVGGRPLEGWLQRSQRWQPVVFGVGQLVFAVGFALAGAQGMARKAYGAEQHIRTTQEWLGLVVMGLGGLVAVVGGVLFLLTVARALLPGRRSNPTPALIRRHA